MSEADEVYEASYLTAGTDDDEDDELIQQARDLLKEEQTMSQDPSSDPPSDEPRATGGADPPVEDPPVSQSTHIQGGYPEEDETIDEEIIEEEILTDGEETIEEEIIEEEFTEGSLRKDESNVQQMGDIPEGGGTASGQPGDSTPPDASASPASKPAPKMDNDLAAFMERRRRAADGEGGGALDVDDKTAHMSNVVGAGGETKEGESVVDSTAEESQPETTSAVPPPPPDPLAEEAEPQEEEQEPQYQERSIDAAPAAMAGAAVGGAAMYYAQQDQEEEEEEEGEEAEEVEESEIYEEEPPLASPVQTYPYQQQQQQNSYNPYQQQQRSFGQPSPYRAAAGVGAAGAVDDVESGVDEQPRDDDKDKANRGAPEASSTGPTWACFALCCIIAALLIAAGVVLGVFLSDDDDDSTNRDIVITPATPAPGQPTPTPPTGPSPAPVIPPITIIPMESGRDITGPTNLGFGAAVAVSSTKMSVGAPSNETGKVFHYTESGNMWDLLDEDNGPNPGSQYGFSMDMNRLNSLIVGAPEASLRGRDLAVGSTYYFTYQPVTDSWELQGEAIQGGRFAENAGERFGEAVALSSTAVRAAIGAPQYGSGTGRVYMYELTGGAWTPMDQQELLGRSGGALLGSAVDMSEDGTIVAVGSPGDSGFHVYEWIQGQWTRTLSESGSANDGMGTSVAVLSNDYVAVGIPAARGGRGIIQLYTKEEGQWTEFNSLIGETGQGIGGKGLVTGTVSPGGDPEVTFGTAGGQVRRFDYISGRWGERFTVDTSFSSLSSVAIDKGSDIVKVWAGSSAAGQVAEFTQVITPAPTRPLTREPTMQPTSAPTRTMAPTTETKFPTTSPTAPPTEIPDGSGWVAYNGPFTGPGENLGFGAAVATKGDVMAAGTPDWSDGMGAVQIFRKVGTNWQPMATVYDSDTQAFGQAIDFSVGEQWTSMIVGAPRTFDNGDFTNLRFGSVQYLEMVNGAWSAVGSILRPEATVFTAGGEFGAAVAVAAETRRIAVGAPQSNLDQNNLRNGRVFTYEYDGTDFVELGPPLDGFASEDRFGYAVAMTEDGSRVLIGAPGTEGSSPGAIYYYELNDDRSWRRLLPLPGSSENENLGTSVAIIASDGETIAMGAPNFEGDRGVVRVYRRPVRTQLFWEQLGEDIVGEPGESIGTTLSGANGRVVVGSATGGFKVYRLVGNAWTEENDGPDNGSPVVSIAANSEEEVVVGLASEEVVAFGLF